MSMEHLEAVRSDRGFATLPAIPSEYGGEVRVAESSAASGPHVWLRLECPADLNKPNGPTVEAVAHLTAENSWRVADQLRHSVRHHYQGDDTPAWARSEEPPASFARHVLALIAEAGCENNTGPGGCSATDRYPEAHYEAERWCRPCLAEAALRGGY